jgi:hypothetical protein
MKAVKEIAATEKLKNICHVLSIHDDTTIINLNENTSNCPNKQIILHKFIL